MMSVVECLGVAVALMSLLSAANAAYCRDGLYYFYCGDGCCYSRSYTYYSYTTVCCSASTESWMIGMGVGVAVVVVLMIVCVLYCRYMASKKARVSTAASQPAKNPAQPVRVGTVVHGQDGNQANYHPPPPPPPQPQMHAFGTPASFPPPPPPHPNPAYPPPPPPPNPAFPPPGNPAYPPPPPPPNPAFPPPGNPAYPPPPAYNYGNAPY